jgi:hypothetical protein
LFYSEASISQQQEPGPVEPVKGAKSGLCQTRMPFFIEQHALRDMSKQKGEKVKECNKPEREFQGVQLNKIKQNTFRILTTISYWNYTS